MVINWDFIWCNDTLRQLPISFTAKYWEQETVFTCLHPIKVQTCLSLDQRLTKPVNRFVTRKGRNLSAIEILNTVENHEWTI